MTAQRTQTWREAVKFVLSKGFGVEDVAIMFTREGIPTKTCEVREEVQRLRASGELTEIYRRQG